MSKEKSTKKAPAKLKKPATPVETPAASATPVVLPPLPPAPVPKKISKTGVKAPAAAAPAKPIKEPAKNTAAKKPGAKTDAKAAKKPVAKKKPGAKTVEVTEVTEVIEISNDDIALRAYFIAERRRHMGWHGDETGDWVEAERQLRSEAAAKLKKASAK